jgi:DNA-directed RNA polymerase specialized sigma24 family protein
MPPSPICCKPAGADHSFDLLDLDEALSELERHDAPAARLVKLRYFAGLSHQEAAEALGVGRRAADRLWALARAWLYQRLGEP